jgi:hypothetical protein
MKEEKRLKKTKTKEEQLGALGGAMERGDEQRAKKEQGWHRLREDDRKRYNKINYED